MSELVAKAIAVLVGFASAQPTLRNRLLWAVVDAGRADELVPAVAAAQRAAEPWLERLVGLQDLIKKSYKIR